MSTCRWLKYPQFDILGIFDIYRNPSPKKTIYNTRLSDVATIMNQRITLFDIIILLVTPKILIDKHWWSFKPIHTLGGWGGICPWCLHNFSSKCNKESISRVCFFEAGVIVMGDKVWEICWVWCSVVYLLSHCPHSTFTPPNSKTVKNNLVCRNFMMWSQNNSKIVVEKILCVEFGTPYMSISVRNDLLTAIYCMPSIEYDEAMTVH